MKWNKIIQLRMKTLFGFGYVVLLAGLIVGLGSSAGADEGPAVWVVKDADTTVYLFGTVELLPPDFEWRSQTFREGFEEAATFYLEDDTGPEARAELGAAIQRLGLLEDGQPLTGLLSADEKMAVERAATFVGFPLGALERFRPWLAAIQIGALGIVKKGYQNRQENLVVLQDMAVQSSKSVHFLEENGTALKAIAGLESDVQIKMLVKTANDTIDNLDYFDLITDLWAKGDVTGLSQALHGSDGIWADPTIYQAVVVQRNRAWTQKISQILETEAGVVFVAVGIGHMVDPDSLPEMLKAEKYEVILK